MAGHEQIAAEVGKNANGCGCVGLPYMKAAGIKVVSIEGAMPTQQVVRGHSWPYTRPMFYYTNGEPSGMAKQFVDFTQVLDRIGFMTIAEVT